MCKVEIWSFQCSYTAIGFHSEVRDILHMCMADNLHTHRLWIFQWGRWSRSNFKISMKNYIKCKVQKVGNFPQGNKFSFKFIYLFNKNHIRQNYYLKDYFHVYQNMSRRYFYFIFNNLTTLRHTSVAKTRHPFIAWLHTRHTLT